MTGSLITLAVFIGASARMAISRPLARCLAWKAVCAGRESRMLRIALISAAESSPTGAGGRAVIDAADACVVAGLPGDEAGRLPPAGRATAAVPVPGPGTGFAAADACCPAHPRVASANEAYNALPIRCMAAVSCA